jgi:NADH-quinone oxidoreductase subunit D
MADLKTYVLGRKNVEDLDDDRAVELPRELMTINMGPSHPAMHGTVRIILTVDGERVVDADVQPGYLHRCFEKESEYSTWTQIFPYTDRLNYVSPMLNNVGFSLACEKMLGIEVPERCQWYRMILGELARISDHLTCDGAMAMELGAFTPFLWMNKAREMVWDVLEEETGARLTHSFGRVGGMASPPTKDFKEHTLAATRHIIKIVDECERLLYGNRIFLDRLEGVGVISPSKSMTGVRTLVIRPSSSTMVFG